MAAHIDEHGLQTPTGDEPLMPPTPTRFDGPAPSLTNSSTHTSFVGSPIAEQGQPMLVATDDRMDQSRSHWHDCLGYHDGREILGER